MFGLVSAIGNVVETYRAESALYKNPLLMAGAVIAVYVALAALLAVITFISSIRYEIRVGLLLFIFYILGTIGLFLSSFSGDGRIFLFVFVILAAIFFEVRYSLLSLAFILLTLAVVGWLQITGVVVVTAERQVNSTDLGSWLSGGIVFTALSIITLVSITYLLQALGKSLGESHESLYREQRLSHMLRTISNINQLIVREQDRGKLLSEACGHLVSGRGYAFAWIGLLNADGITLNLAASAGETLVSESYTIRLDQKEAALSCPSIAIHSRKYFKMDASSENNPCASCPLRVTDLKYSAIALPLLRDEHVFGVLVVDDVQPAGVFDNEEIQLLQELADDLAYALGNLEANNQLQTYARHQALLNEITQTALGTPNLESMLQKFIEGLEKALNADGYYIALWDEEKQTPVQFVGSDALKVALSVDPILTPDDKIFSRSILDAGRVLAIEDILNTPYVSPHVATVFPARSALGLPLIANNKKLGALVFGFREVHQFTPDELEFGEQASRQIALSIMKARLDADTHTKAVELGRLYAAAQDMAASTLLDPSALLAKLARHMTEALQSTSANIMSANLVDGTMQVVAEYWSDEASPAEVHSDLGNTYQNSEYATIINAMVAGEALIMHSDDTVMTPIECEQFAVYGIKSMMFIPIMSHGQLFGNIEIWESRRRREFNRSEIRLALTMAGHAASIIETSSLFAITRQRESELGALLTVERAVSSSLQLSDVLKQAATTLARLLRVDYCSLFDYLPDQNGIVTTAIFSDDGDVSKPGDLGRYFSLKDYPATLQVLESGQSMVVRVDDPKADPAEVRQLRRDNMIMSLLIPLRLRGRSLGLAELFSSDPLRNFKPEEVQFAGALADQVAVAIENGRLYERLEQRESYFRALFENSAEGVAVVDTKGSFTYITSTEENILGYDHRDILGMNFLEVVHPDDAARVYAFFEKCLQEPNQLIVIEYRALHADQSWRHLEVSLKNLFAFPSVRGIVANFRDITVRKQAEQALKESQSRMEAIISTAINGIITINSEQQIVLFNPSAERIFGCSVSEAIGQRLEKFIPQRYRHSHEDHIRRYAETNISNRYKGLLDSLSGLRSNGDEFPMEAFISQSEVDGQKFFTVIFQDITERMKTENALKASEIKFRALAENIPSTVYMCKNDARYTFLYLNDSVEELTGYSKKAFLEEGLSFYDLYHPDDLKNIPPASGMEMTDQNKFHITYRIRHKSGEWRWVDEWGTDVMDGEGEIQYSEGVLIDITERKRTEEDLRRHAHELETLALSSFALRAAQNVTEMIPILARQALQMVGGDYGAVFLLDPERGDFVLRGWYSANGAPESFVSEKTTLRHRLGEGITGYVAETGEIYLTEDIQQDPHVLILEEEQERLKNLRGGVSLPLRAQEKVIGVLHIRTVKRRIFTETDIRLLIALVENAGNAIHRAMLFEQTLQHANELTQAYDNTLAGWARALELRDEVTEGHTRRVTELTIRLARALGIPESEIIHIRRGALLHDIGKMGIPDSILHKPGAFTVHERIIMEQHTHYAYDMLSPISFLQAALDIPLCHHEHWDGNGYPRKLKGEQIPLPARIFTVIDVWDALTSDRPYRAAWTYEKTREYILERAGKQFDPRVVEAFFSLEFE